jgi:hypothetical protein
MVIATVESVCSSLRGEFLKLLYAKKNVVPCASEPNYADVSSVISSVAAFLQTVKNDDALYVFPLSLVMLSRTEAYGIVMKLMEAAGIRKHGQLIVCIDGNINDALAEMIDNGDKVLLTLDELHENREVILRGVSPKMVFSTRHVVVRAPSSDLASAAHSVASQRPVY